MTCVTSHLPSDRNIIVDHGQVQGGVALLIGDLQDVLQRVLVDEVQDIAKNDLFPPLHRQVRGTIVTTEKCLIRNDPHENI